MRLVDDWRLVLRHAWSLRFMALAAFLSGVNGVLPYLSFLPLPQWLVTAIILAAIFARFVPQKKISGARRGKQD